MHNATRRSLFAGVLLAVAFILAACADDADTPTAAADTPTTQGTEPTTTEPGESAAGPVRIGLVLPDLTNQTINDLFKGAQARADEIGGIELLQGGTSDSGPWLDACDTFVASGVDVLMYDTLDGEAHSSYIEDANEA